MCTAFATQYYIRRCIYIRLLLKMLAFTTGTFFVPLEHFKLAVIHLILFIFMNALVCLFSFNLFLCLSVWVFMCLITVSILCKHSQLQKHYNRLFWPWSATFTQYLLLQLFRFPTGMAIQVCGEYFTRYGNTGMWRIMLWITSIQSCVWRIMWTTGIPETSIHVYGEQCALPQSKLLM